MPDRWSHNPLCRLLGIPYPVIQGGMIHNSGAELAAAAAEAGCLGLIAAGSFRPDDLRAEIRRCRELTGRRFGVNLPLIHAHAAGCLEVILDEGIDVVVTSAGSPRRVAGPLEDAGVTWLHVASSPALARKCQEAGCDAVVVEGFEAGGHDGREELTTMVLVPAARRVVDVPLVAAGGIATGAQLAAALALGADGVQIGSRFAVTRESAAHPAFKRAVVEGDDTRLVLKKHIPVRLLRNPFRERVEELEARGASREELVELLGSGRARRGMAEGDLVEGELEIGQVAALIDDVPAVAEVVDRLLAEFDAAVARLVE